ncbi:acyl-CoA thioesterase [Spongiibacter sp. KMU-158]|uniref:Acyl-CoA thioesterase n=1 Tax=Spongiibacter pelagi TaxID=2760804 RepID=A0A927GX03_9GAMM|nr:thioesterase family protein [Spongiibacter pelagi]MBD2859487.1 acyl-CoA thioesterase [Spongiibacter pelagi]
MTHSDERDLTQRSQYFWFMPITTRWMDNDIYGHVNNVNYYSYFDTVANSFLIQEGGLDIHNGHQIGYIVHSECFYKQALVFPQELEGALRVNKLGNSSVQYGLAIFKKGEDKASAYGNFTHVFVDRETEKPQPINDHLRKMLSTLMDASEN